MTGRERFILQVEEAADKIAEIPRHELQILLRRAALRLRNMGDGLDQSRADVRSFSETAPGFEDSAPE